MFFALVMSFFTTFVFEYIMDMNRKYFFCVMALTACSLTACKEKVKTETIIATKPVEEVQHGPVAMQETKQESDIDWASGKYKVAIVRTADETLPLTKDEAGHSYYDNKITVRVTRADGSEFFAKTFTKSDFSQCLDDNLRKNGALLGIVFDKTEDSQLRFAASVGSPDVLSDQYLPMVLTISRMGAVSIVKDNRLDSDAEEEEEGV
jgi:hypothetical protein